ncbi:alpha/beta hydrolase [Chitinophaga sancti]|uniref:Acetyl esterase/lipase n=1 Tax=Chitinophaga sancti TaxID=1004 RepID=A0A1K1RLV1_9BACT|nr:alpha/beta hydrolase [Chitinophaga sancti]WQD62648.1 alpha/beta hydrolase [Chitinophaga sancti]WQG91729.1 alpha/beta hydrolase [Chitinophaga sancti]SFW73243.1 Acetyl esterase/lipase [Chitinophaga sancti]
MKTIRLLVIVLVIGMHAFAQDKDIIHIWPGEVPGETSPKQPAHPTSDSSRGVVRLTDVTDPTLQVFLPAKPNGAAVVICPGGGYKILAINLEGYEIAKWLNSLGFTAFVLQYRVPDKEQGALQDVQRAIRLVKSRATAYKINPDKVGVLGFSAGGSLSARISTLYDTDSYAKVDDADRQSAKPAFSVLIYPAYLDKGENRSLTPELKVNANTPPIFLFATADDPYGNSALVMAGALRDAKVPVELHFMSQGGHGYGLRKGNIAAETWPSLAAKWLAPIADDDNHQHH